MHGTIFSIEEFSVFDGPGIRCSIFLKGCPLRCQWCHNPEGQSFSPEIMRSPNGCLHCGACLQAGLEETGSPCIVAGSILRCPNHLLRMCGESLTPQELVDRLIPKLPLLESAGGGITFSGGEPLAQPEFLLECLTLLAGKAHRAIQTSGYAPQNIFQQVLNHCEYVLFDLKLMDSGLHRHFTGVDNRRILDNYRTLAASGKPFITRIPLIPGVNDTEENLTATAQLLSGLGIRQIELLPYNKAAGAKYKALNRSYAVDFDQAIDPDPHKNIFYTYNIEVNVL